MTLNCVMALILRYFAELGSFRYPLRKSGWLAINRPLRGSGASCNRGYVTCDEFTVTTELSWKSVHRQPSYWWFNDFSSLFSKGCWWANRYEWPNYATFGRTGQSPAFLEIVI